MSRRLDALRSLAERPSTPAEGAVARAKLAAHVKKHGGSGEKPAARVFLCQCGAARPANGRCANTSMHDAVRVDVRRRYPIGSRVYYNYWAYDANSPANVVGYSRTDDRLGWVRLKFDHLKNVRPVPIWSQKHGYRHLSMEPVSEDEAMRLRWIHEGNGPWGI